MSPFTPAYCPRCATAFVDADDHGTWRPTCPACGFIWYRNPVPAAGTLIVRDGRVLMVKRAWEPRAGTWCLPAGFMEAGETPQFTALRELEEETGVVGELTGLFNVYAGLDDPRVRTVLILFVARIVGGAERPGDDAIALEWFPLAALPPERDIAFASHRQALAEYGAGRRAHPGPIDLAQDLADFERTEEPRD